MSQRERDRMLVIRQVAEKQLVMGEGARRLGLSRRQMRRLVRAWEEEGDGSVVHGLRGRPSNRRLGEELRAKALAKARDPVYRDFRPTLLSEHLERDGDIGAVHASTLRLWMIAEGLWEAKPRGARHRRRRERRAAFGELVLMDTSIHPWLEDRSDEEIVLIALIDDATSRLYGRFFPRDTGAANRRTLIEWLERHGRMGAVYADGAGHFRVNFRARERREKGEDEALTLIRRALKALDIELIIALSPQAKGRVERLFGTLQDRLIKEMRVKGVRSMEQANRFLEEEFIPFWEGRFTVEPAVPVDAHRPLPDEVDLLRIFAETEQRVIRNDFTLRYANRFYQIEAKEADGRMPGSRITIETRLDGTLRFRWKDRYLLPVPLLGEPAKPKAPKPPAKATANGKPASQPKVRPAPADHPWRRFPILVGKGRVQSPASQATSSSPNRRRTVNTP